MRVQFKDGAVLDIKEDSWCQSSGCETCNWGSSYITDLTLVTTQGVYQFKVDQMYSGLDHDELLTMFLNVDKEQTISEFVGAIKASLEKDERSKHPEVTLTHTTEVPREYAHSNSG